MIIGIQDEILKVHSIGLLDKLLEDKTTKSNILWATDAYQSYGEDYRRDKEIKTYMITGNNSAVIKNRARKELEQQAERVKQRGEVFTPLWVCQKMINHIDESWFGKNAQVCETDTPPEKSVFSSKRSWKRYVDSRCMEITCGEAPFLVTRYDVLTGEIIPIENRIGILDRKLRAVNENAANEAEWLKWVIRAYQSTYGYEFQGDSLLIARINFLMTFEDYLAKRWRRKPEEAEYKKIANITAWNLWQMDGLTGKIPYCSAQQKYFEVNLFASGDIQPEIKRQPACRIYNWRRDNSMEFLNVNKGGSRDMKFDFIIGNPPYQEENENSVRKTPIYNKFMDASFKMANVVELITPARFLFDAGQTPKVWNEKMLNDKHFTVLYYENDASVIFPNTDIKGGIAISIKDNKKDYGKIMVFTPYNELNNINKKVRSITKEDNFMDSIVSQRGMYRFTDNFFNDFPYAKDRVGAGTNNMIVSNIFKKIPEVFFENKVDDDEKYYLILGREKNERIYKYIKSKYVIENKYIGKYKVFFPEANGSGKFGEILTLPEIGKPFECSTDTFINIGMFETEYEAKVLLKYIKTKFFRSLLGIKKATQHTPKTVWKCIPLQDFTNKSDIDWSKSITEIDRQLYKKYGLDENEIKFIETHVKEMA